MEQIHIRERYLQKIRPYMGKNIIKVLTGQRRVGKSTILKQLIVLAEDEFKDVNTIYINKELYEFRHIKTSEDLYQYVKSRLSDKKRNYVFIDEIQEISGFEIALRQMFSEGNDLYCTGSNAKMLSGDLATHLSGRYIEFHIHSLSYREFIEFHRLENTNDTLNKFIRYGGLPYLIHLTLDDDLVYGYLKSIYDTVILKDIVGRYSIRDIEFLDRLVEYLADNLGNYVSSKKISDFLKAQRVSLSINTVMNYMKYLTNAFFINRVQRLDIVGKKRFEINDKYYFSDLGLRNTIIPFSDSYTGSVFENLVYNHLIYNDYKVFIGKHQDREIDFVVQKGDEIKYLQVAYLIPDDKVREREFGNLLKINDNYEKIVVSADEFAGDMKGIRHMHIRDYLVLSDLEK
jgi:predicted AAA+ superfamily ATPase